MSKKKKELKDVELPEGPGAPPPLGPPPRDEVPGRTGEFLMKDGVPVPRESNGSTDGEPIEEIDFDEIKEGDMETDPEYMPPPLPTPPSPPSQAPDVLEEVEQAIREVRASPAARALQEEEARARLLGSPIPAVVADKTALQTPPFFPPKPPAGPVEKPAARRTVSTALDTTTAKVRQAVGDHQTSKFFRDGDRLNEVVADVTPVFSADDEPVLRESWRKKIRVPNVSLPRISMPWGGKTPVTVLDEDGYPQSSLPSSKRRQWTFAVFMFLLAGIVLYFPLKTIYSGKNGGTPSQKKVVEMAKAEPAPQKQEKQVATTDNTVSTPPAKPATSVPAPSSVATADKPTPPSDPPAQQVAPQPSVPTSAKPPVDKPVPASSVPPEPPAGKKVADAPPPKVVAEAPPKPVSSPAAPPPAPAPIAPPAVSQPVKSPSASTPAARAIERQLAKTPPTPPPSPVAAPTPAPSKPASPGVAGAAMPGKPVKAASPSAIPKPAVVPVPVPVARPTEVCSGARVNCPEGLTACIERVTLAHDKHVAKGACTWKCGAPCLPGVAGAAMPGKPVPVAPASAPTSEPPVSVATSSAPCPEGKELCILKLKFRLGEAAAKGACWRCTK